MHCNTHWHWQPKRIELSWSTWRSFDVVPNIIILFPKRFKSLKKDTQQISKPFLVIFLAPEADLLKEPPSELVCRIVLASQAQPNKEDDWVWEVVHGKWFGLRLWLVLGFFRYTLYTLYFYITVVYKHYYTNSQSLYNLDLKWFVFIRSCVKDPGPGFLVNGLHSLVKHILQYITISQTKSKNGSQNISPHFGSTFLRQNVVNLADWLGKMLPGHSAPPPKGLVSPVSVGSQPSQEGAQGSCSWKLGPLPAISFHVPWLEVWSSDSKIMGCIRTEVWPSVFWGKPLFLVASAMTLLEFNKSWFNSTIFIQ